MESGCSDALLWRMLHYRTYLNPWLLQKYHAHINVEYCASIKAGKCLYKYICKDSDRATIAYEVDVDHVRVDMEDRNDNVRQYEQCRFIGESQATCRIFAFPTQDYSPAVDPLPVHLPDEQRVMLNSATTAPALEAANQTKLTAYFAKNCEDPQAFSILYCDFPEHFTWQPAAKVWKWRARSLSNPSCLMPPRCALCVRSHTSLDKVYKKKKKKSTV